MAVTCWMTPQKMPPRKVPPMLPSPPMVVAMMMIGISENPTEGEVGK